MLGIEDILLTDALSLIPSLGAGGGVMSPAIYDTAQILRTLPEFTDKWATIDWLLSLQQSDGGWGELAMPIGRHIPTFAAILAIRQHDRRKVGANAVDAGLSFLRHDASAWLSANTDELPVGGEVILPALLEQLEPAEVASFPKHFYQRVFVLRDKKRSGLSKSPPRPGVPWNHIWEVAGVEPDLRLLDESGGVGHSPAATAAWIRASLSRSEAKDALERSRQYLVAAQRASGLLLPGSAPTVYPFDRFEQSFALHAFQIAGLLDHPSIAEAIRPMADILARAVRTGGIGMSDAFLADGDDTAATLMLLHAVGLKANPETILRFMNDDHFVAYEGELQPSTTVTARCIHALSTMGLATDRFHPFILSRQQMDGRWSVDKWNRSWLYTTCVASTALQASPHRHAIHSAMDIVLSQQSRDGGWSTHGPSNITETAYAVLMLSYLERHGIQVPRVATALDGAFQWMMENYRPRASSTSKPKCWIGKELYRVERLDTSFELAAMLALVRRTKNIGDEPS